MQAIKNLKQDHATTHIPCGLQARQAEEAHEQCAVAGQVNKIPHGAMRYAY
jgi:hypothetical protein